MIEKLKKREVIEAAKVYSKGLSMEIPKGRCRLHKLITILDKEVECFVHKTNNKIDGLISFEFNGKSKIKVDFICALKLRKGIGKRLMKKLANYCLRRNIKSIYSNVSTKDKKVMSFYKYCGFKKYGQYYAGKDFLLNRVKATPTDIKMALKN